MKLRVEIKFEPRDLWVGVFFDTDKDKLYVCAIPCFPVIVQAEPDIDGVSHA
jgi:hypothetical protein